jgi:hypothetical protein
MKDVPADHSALRSLDAVPTLKRAVRKGRRPLAALRPVAADASGLEARVNGAVQAVIQEEIQRMTRRVYARLPGIISRAMLVSEP